MQNLKFGDVNAERDERLAIVKQSRRTVKEHVARGGRVRQRTKANTISCASAFPLTNVVLLQKRRPTANNFEYI
jgi:hypothetical protein